ncbi:MULTISPECIES: CDP-glycerol glycerophosphotransferase family protein [unclassified Fibrobacter]|uniref:CDP-glycerol glycerophosphotransferase family protein n=1 Tax=unclassified Fibrobacter TaxID=2634177 RepID=UPI001304EDEC|nr:MULTISPECIES: CDP-glycerol glycerophosphotransferase family protein [unclassified Fibrobacter]
MNKLFNALVYRFWSYLYLLYRPYVTYKAKKIRKKNKIRVLFILAELGSWKTEALFKAMLKHPRFEAILGVTTSQEVPGSKQPLIDYIKSKGYDYIDLDNGKNVIEQINPDIKFYYKPYSGSYPISIGFKKHLRSLTCHIHYAFNTGSDFWAFGHLVCKYSWFVFLENEAVYKTRLSVKKIYHGNVAITGYPMQDQLCASKTNYANPWKSCGEKKKIIYAPHHSFPGTNGIGIEYATFLVFGEFLLKMAEKYKDSVQWAFKPHPTLYPKLIKKWGKQKTDQYYKTWESLENTQIELGEYAGLFKHSDAMIHDCSSFTVEYMFSQNPVLFLQLDAKQTDRQGEFGHEAFLAHYLASSESAIESFIKNVIAETDPLREKRISYYNKYLLPPNNKSACDNIISKILND